MNKIARKILLALCLTVNASAIFPYDFEYNGLYFNIFGMQEVEITSYKPNSISHYSGEIPDKVFYDGKEYPVTRIGSQAFLYNKYLRNVVIPNSVKEISDWAFHGCEQLRALEIGDGVKTIGKYAFGQCDSLRSVIFGASVWKIEDEAFQFCRKLSSIKFNGKELYSIGVLAFAHCGLTSMVVPSSVEIIGASAFKDNRELTDFIYPPNFRYENDWTRLEDCTKLRKVAYPKGASSLFLSNLRGCKVEYDRNCIVFEDGLIFDKTMSTIYYVPSTFEGDYEIPSSVKVIGKDAFRSCRSLTAITIPSSVESIEEYAFWGSGISAVLLPSSVRLIGMGAFMGCDFSSIVIPSSIESIAGRAFDGCDNLNEVYVMSVRPPEIGYYKNWNDKIYRAFGNKTYEMGTLYVPDSTSYSIVPGWREFCNISQYGIKLDRDEINIEVGNSIKLSAEIFPSGKMDWASLDPNVAKVDNSGNITAISVGTTVISVSSMSSSGIEMRASCKVKVLKAVQEISINNVVTILKKGRNLELSATILPSDATIATLDWSSSNEDIAVIDNNGLISAKTIGTTRIKAMATDGFGAIAEFELTVIPPQKGDANDNDEVNIADAVGIANYAVGNEVPGFCFEAADVNEDNRITVSDALGTVEIILNQPEEITYKKSVSRSEDNPSSSGLIVGNCSFDSDGLAWMDMRLDNSLNLVGIQADIMLPEGIVLESIDKGVGLNDSHLLIVRNIGENAYRVVVFAPADCKVLPSNKALVSLRLRNADKSPEDILFHNIIACDGDAEEYHLPSNVAPVNISSGIPEIDVLSKAGIALENQSLVFKNLIGQKVSLYTSTGILVSEFIVDTDLKYLNLEMGVYIVKAGEIIKKIIIR